MNVFEAVKTMLAIRRYKDRPIPDEVVERILQAGRLTASSKNMQNWDFIVIRDRQRLEQIGRMAQTGSYIASATLAIAVIVPDRVIGYADGARAVQDMMLVAWQEGIGSNWVGNVNTDAIRNLLNVPQDRFLLTIVPFGYPVQNVGQGIKDRKPLPEIAHLEQFGQPFQLQR